MKPTFNNKLNLKTLIACVQFRIWIRCSFHHVELDKKKNHEGLIYHRQRARRTKHRYKFRKYSLGLLYHTQLLPQRRPDSTWEPNCGISLDPLYPKFQTSLWHRSQPKFARKTRPQLLIPKKVAWTKISSYETQERKSTDKNTLCKLQPEIQWTVLLQTAELDWIFRLQHPPKAPESTAQR